MEIQLLVYTGIYYNNNFDYVMLLLKQVVFLCQQKHASECVKIPTDCSNGCGLVITREEVKDNSDYYTIRLNLYVAWKITL